VLKACARVGKPTIAILVPSDGSNMDSARLASAHRIGGAFTVSPGVRR
jgi:hypothetical protein